MKYFRFANDKMNSKENSIFKLPLLSYFAKFRILQFDKVQHLLLGVVLGLFGNLTFATIFNLSWEVKDGLLPYEKYGSIGGDGFSFRDFSATQIGIFVGLSIREIIKEFMR